MREIERKKANLENRCAVRENPLKLTVPAALMSWRTRPVGYGFPALPFLSPSGG